MAITRIRTNPPMESSSTVEQAAPSEVLVVSSINRDMTFTVPRLPILPGETMLSTSHTTSLGGKGANTAVAARRADAHTHFLGAVGRQTDVLHQLSAYGVQVSHVQTLSDADTGQAVILLDAAKENCIVVHPGANTLVTEAILKGVSDVLARAVLVLHLEIDHAVVQKLAKRARSEGSFIILNPSPVPRAGSPLRRDDSTVWSCAHVIIMNQIELVQLAACDQAPSGSLPDDVDAICELVRAFKSHRRAPADVVITLGARGVVLVSRDDSFVFLNAVPVQSVVDTTGAGDCLTGFLAAGLARGESLHAALRVAIAASALCVGKVGAAPSMPCLQDVIDLMQ